MWATWEWSADKFKVFDKRLLGFVLRRDFDCPPYCIGAWTNLLPVVHDRSPEITSWVLWAVTYWWRRLPGILKHQAQQ